MSDPVRSEIPKIDAGHVTIGIGVLYLFGFVVANIHFGKYELPRIELLRARYLAAALLFLLCSAIPFAVGVFVSRALRTRPIGNGKLQPNLTFGETEAWAMGTATFFLWVIYAAVMYTLLVSGLTLHPFVALDTGALYFAVASVVSLALCMTLLGGEASSDAQVWPSLRTPGRILAVALWVLSVPATFSSLVYGSIKPELGGGAVWKARLTWRATADSSVRANAAGIVAIVDVDEHTLNVIACAKKGRPTLLSIPAADVSSVQPGELVSPSSFVNEYVSHCSRFDAEQRMPTGSWPILLAFAIVSFTLAVFVAYKNRPLAKDGRLNTG